MNPTKKTANANNSNVLATSAQETCVKFLDFVKSNYPQLKGVKFKQKHKNSKITVYSFRAKWQTRLLYAQSSSVELAMMKFMFEIHKKVFVEPYYPKEVYQFLNENGIFYNKKIKMNLVVREIPEFYLKP